MSDVIDLNLYYETPEQYDPRLRCTTCGEDLGSADDPYRDPDCMRCFKASLESEMRDE